jgi:hypothetical protein
VAGLLNLIIIIDVLARIEARPVRAEARDPPGKGKR